MHIMGFPGGSVVNSLPANAGDSGDKGSSSGFGRSPGVGNSNPLVFLPGEFHEQKSLAGYRPWGGKE